jgi:hypothetical protein
MDLRKITGLLIVSFIASFLIRTTGTFFPVIFTNPYVVKVSIVVNSLFMLLHLLFYAFFLRQYVANGRQIMRTASVLAIIGSCFVAFIYIKNFCLVFELDIIPLSLMNHHFDAILPLASSLLYLLFFAMFKTAQSQKEFGRLDRPISLAIIGSAIFSILHLVVLINFLKSHKFTWLEHMPRNIVMSTVPLIALATILILYFYIRFYQFLLFQKNINVEPYVDLA